MTVLFPYIAADPVIRKMQAEDIGLPSFKGELEALIERWGGWENGDVVRAMGGGGPDDAAYYNWGSVHDMKDALTEARRCMTSPHRGPQESLIFIEKAESILDNGTDAW